MSVRHAHTRYGPLSLHVQRDRCGRQLYVVRRMLDDMLVCVTCNVDCIHTFSSGAPHGWSSLGGCSVYVCGCVCLCMNDCCQQFSLQFFFWVSFAFSSEPIGDIHHLIAVFVLRERGWALSRHIYAAIAIMGAELFVCAWDIWRKLSFSSSYRIALNFARGIHRHMHAWEDRSNRDGTNAMNSNMYRCSTGTAWKCQRQQ